MVLEFAWGTDMDMAEPRRARQARYAAAAARSEEAAAAALQSVDRSDHPAFGLSLAGAKRSGRRTASSNSLRRFADDELKKRLEPVAGVAAVKVGGGLEDESKSTRPATPGSSSIDINDVIKRLADENVNVSGGRIESGSSAISCARSTSSSMLDEMRDLLIKVDGACRCA